MVPEETRPWNPLIAPQAIVTNRNGMIGGESDDILSAGAVISGWKMKIDVYISPSPTNSWCEFI